MHCVGYAPFLADDVSSPWAVQANASSLTVGLPSSEYPYLQGDRVYPLICGFLFICGLHLCGAVPVTTSCWLRPVPFISGFPLCGSMPMRLLVCWWFVLDRCMWPHKVGYGPFLLFAEFLNLWLDAYEVTYVLFYSLTSLLVTTMNWFRHVPLILGVSFCASLDRLYIPVPG